MDPAKEQDWSARAAALKAAGDLPGAAQAYAAAVRMRPQSAVAEHNLAATLGDLGDHAGAIAATQRAIHKGGNAPETWLVRARSLQAMGDTAAAEHAYQEAIRRRPDYAVAHRDLAQLRWMLSASPAEAMRSLDGAPDTRELALVRATVLGGVGDQAAARRVVAQALQRGPGDLALQLTAAAQAGRAGDAAAQLAHATAALKIAPASIEAGRAAVEALLHAGRIGEAVGLAERVVAAAPDDQAALALLATAWRLSGDTRHTLLCEDKALISHDLIPVPAGWSDRDAFLHELAGALRELHGWRSHPLGQSLRHGSQTQVDLTKVQVPVIQALFATLPVLIDAHVAGLGRGDDPVRRRIGVGWRIAGAWSVQLQPGGFHTDHVHPEGWLSSAFYVSLPKVVAREPEGWLAFGRPGIATTPPLEPFRRLRPEPGMLALFPSYLWHGTEPFSGEEPRLTVAFDIVPG
ncbi:2OG-Fe(II) oxygenase family protein [Sphingomonas sp. CCH5-D11]|uniref:2OG-Fe(II) oxygenase family protein n=1 Tax=Sphingomonas sp. CCH5-D11 TaxID=1768786 RepID=UPI00082C4EC2|nr:2OG-Fe(II) oxygenase family protein [Sphingomonas sp. CCH5-D11]